MSIPTIQPSGIERTFGEVDIIVSRADTKARLTYVNQVFPYVSGYTGREMLSQPHNTILRPDMPHCILRLVWGDRRGQARGLGARQFGQEGRCVLGVSEAVQNTSIAINDLQATADDLTLRSNSSRDSMQHLMDPRDHGCCRA